MFGAAVGNRLLADRERLGQYGEPEYHHFDEIYRTDR